MMIASMLSGAEYVPPTTAPDGPPVSPSLYTYQGGKVGVQWTSGDTAAETEIGYRADPFATLEPLSVLDTTAPAVTGWESGIKATTQACTYWVRHKKGGQVTAWVAATHSLTCPEPE